MASWATPVSLQSSRPEFREFKRFHDEMSKRLEEVSEVIRSLSITALQGGVAVGTEEHRGVLGALEEIGRYLCDHHRDEECWLFPALIVSGIRPAHDLVLDLMLDHRRLEKQHWALSEVVSYALRNNDSCSPLLLEQVRHVFDQLVSQHARHRDIEDQRLLPLVKQLIDPQELAALDREMATRQWGASREALTMGWLQCPLSGCAWRRFVSDHSGLSRVPEEFVEHGIAAHDLEESEALAMLSGVIEDLD
jgi:hemerythrin-like domain-containing protein